MATLFDAAGDLYSRSASVPVSTAMSVLMRVYVLTVNDAYKCFFSIDNASDYFVMETDSDGTTLLFTSSLGSGGFSSSHSMAATTWYDIGFTNASGTGCDLFWATTGSTAAFSTVGSSHANTTMSSPVMYIGNNGFAELGLCRIAGVKIWDAGLTAAEMEQERTSLRPIKQANLWAYYPLYNHTDVADMSGNARTLTAGGTLTTVDGPPVSSLRCKSRLILPASAAPPATAYPWHYYQQMGAC